LLLEYKYIKDKRKTLISLLDWLNYKSLGSRSFVGKANTVRLRMTITSTNWTTGKNKFSK